VEWYAAMLLAIRSSPIKKGKTG